MGATEPVNVYEAKTQLSKLIDRAMAGEDVVISRSGRPMVRLVPVPPRPSRRTPGERARADPDGPDFDDLPADVAAAFRGERP